MSLGSVPIHVNILASTIALKTPYYERSCPYYESVYLSPVANHNPAIFFAPFPQTLKTEQVPTGTEGPDDSNILHKFNNNTYSGFRTARVNSYQHVLIPSYVIRVI